MRSINLLSALLLTFATAAYAHESKVNLPLSEIETNQTASASLPSPMNAGRVFQLQLQAAKCDRPIVASSKLEAGATNEFTVITSNCILKKKASESCDSGFEARNLPVNPHNKKDTILGGALYKVCVEMNNSVSGSRASGARTSD